MLKKFKKGAKLLLIGALVFSMTVPAYAATKEEVQDRINQMEQQKESLKGTLNNLREEQSSTEAYIAELQSQLEDLRAQIDEKNQELADTQAELEQTQADLEVAIANEEHQYETLKKRIKVMYEKGDTAYLEVLLSADSIGSLLNNQEYISKITDYDKNLLQALADTRQQIADYEAQLIAHKEELEILKQELEGTQERLSMVAEEMQNQLLALNAQINSTSANINDLDSSIENAQAEYDRIVAEEKALEEARIKAEEFDRQQAELKRQQEEQAAQNNTPNDSGSGSGSGSGGGTGNGSGTSTPSGGGSTTPPASASSFIWPLSGYSTISSGFGYRTHPITGATSSFHSGIDIPAGSGTPVKASASGTVSVVSYQSSMGNYIVVSHGGGIQTYYLHLSSFNVSVGQTVSQGQTIGGVGSTGDSTGPHLHFSVMVNGSYVSPLGYVSP